MQLKSAARPAARASRDAKRLAHRRPGAVVIGPAALLIVVLALVACGNDGPGTGLATRTNVRVVADGLVPLDSAIDGAYRLWLIDATNNFTDAGSIAGGDAVDLTFTVNIDPSAVRHAMITVEPPGDADPGPSPEKLLGGAFTDGAADLDVNGYVTAGIPLEPAPGTHALFTPSDNTELGYPSHEDAGLWLFNVEGDTADGSFYITLTPLTRGWTYEGWVVRDHASPDAVWLSYGKFAPDDRRKVDTRDDTGLGPFSGQIDYAEAMPQEIFMPGDDWIANPHGYPVPGGLTLPIDLNGDPAAGIASRWTHVITIEPARDTAEASWLAQPFPLLRVYQDAIGEGGVAEPRTIRYVPGDLPHAVVTLLPAG